MDDLSNSEKQSLIEKSVSNNEISPVSNFRSRWTHRLVVFCILATELCERLTFFSITGNLVIFATNELGYSSIQAVTVSLIFVGKKVTFVTKNIVKTGL